MPSWDPDVYADFAAERARPFTDLVARIGAGGAGSDGDVVHGVVRRVVDLGCGPGDQTATLARRWPDAEVVGVDSSESMIERAERQATGELRGRLRFELADVVDWVPDQPVDVIVTNALLQWVPGHLALLPRLMQSVAPGGWFAMQVPGNFSAISHQAMRDLTQDRRFFDRLQGVLRGTESVAQPSTYASLLAETGATVDVWETTYLHVLDPEGRFGDDAVLAWVSGTGLRPVLDVLADDPPLRQAFLDSYSAALRKAYPRKRWGTLLPFRRVFAVAHRPVDVVPGRRTWQEGA
ncbi:MAG TPA: methyltransferase domain-containing protein [Actinomycetales bacterium]|nr:methyltransferase domain-containing protein [Actinomycetales bacterium]